MGVVIQMHKGLEQIRQRKREQNLLAKLTQYHKDSQTYGCVDIPYFMRAAQDIESKKREGTYAYWCERAMGTL